IAAGYVLKKVKHVVLISSGYGFDSVIFLGMSKLGTNKPELKEKKQKVEDAINATKAAVEEGTVVGGRFMLLCIAAKVDNIKETFGNDEPEVGLDIVKRAVGYPMKLIAKNVDQ
ncbi:RuBisCO large subunit-binding protein subunit beta, chloroplastic, partial [Tanacetum coccineum]